MATFKDIPVNERFSFPKQPVGSQVMDVGLCVKVSPRRYQSMGKPTIYTIGTTACEVIPRGENTPIRWTDRRNA